MKYLIVAFFTLGCIVLSGDVNAQNDCFSVSPNPTIDFSTITWADSEYTGSLQVIIFDITGKQIEEMLIDRYDKPFILDATGLESGLYVIQIISEDPLALCNSLKFWKD